MDVNVILKIAGVGLLTAIVCVIFLMSISIVKSLVDVVSTLVSSI